MQRREKRPLNCWRHSHVLGAYLRKILPQKKEKNQTLIGNFDQEIGEIVQIDSCSSMCIVIMQQAFIIWWYQALMFEFPWFYFQWMTLTLIQLLCYSWDWIVPFFFFKELSTNGYANDKKIHRNCTTNLDYTLYIESQYVNILHIEIPVSISTLPQKKVNATIRFIFHISNSFNYSSMFQKSRRISLSNH